MFGIGTMELLVIAILALIVVGPKELPKLLRTVGGIYRKAREITAEFREGVSSLAAEAEREVDPFQDLRKSEGITPGMSPEEITDHILGNRERAAQAPVSDEARKASDNAASAKVSKNKPSNGEGDNG